MKKTYYYRVFRVPPGFIGLVATYKGPHSLYFPGTSRKEIETLIKREFPGARRAVKKLSGIAKKIVKYYSGHAAKFNMRVDLGGYGEFERKAYEVVRGIGRGEVRSYSWVARQLGDKRMRRAVGQAMARNRLPIIIPCHRVVGTSGLGGFSFGTESKYRLLKLEGAVL